MSALAVGVMAGAVVVAAGGAAAPPLRRRPPPQPGRSRPVAPAPAWLAESTAILAPSLDASQAWRAVRWVAPALLLVGAVIAGPGVALILLLSGAAAPKVLGGWARRRRSLQREDQLAPVLESVAAAVRAGSTLSAALRDVAAVQPGPLGPELRDVCSRVERGAPIEKSVGAWAESVPTPSVALTAAALSVASASGGQVARALDGVAATLRDRRQARAEVHALATQARSSAWVLAGAPLGFALLVATIEPGIASFLLRSRVGVACLIGGLALDAAGLRWMARIVRGAP